MKVASLRGHHLQGNSIFDKNHAANRDNCFDPYIQLKNKFLEHGIELNTTDLNKNKEIMFELHQDAHLQSESVNTYLMMFETVYIGQLNQNKELLKSYKKIFTWCDDLLDGKRYIKFNFPNPIVVPEINGFRDREAFCCLIAGNKSASIPVQDNLYLERVKTIRWFETHHPDKFNLYGIDWDLPIVPAGLMGKLLKKFYRAFFPFLKIKPFPSYRGRVDHKSNVLRKHRFSICYENVANQNGYITEKIFDCFFSGCVPVYWGAGNIDRYIPSNCYIDRQKFSSHEALYEFMHSINEAKFKQYQKNIAHFLKSDQCVPFSSEYFAHTVVEEIINDLNI